MFYGLLKGESLFNNWHNWSVFFHNILFVVGIWYHWYTAKLDSMEFTGLSIYIVKLSWRMIYLRSISGALILIDYGSISLLWRTYFIRPKSAIHHRVSQCLFVFKIYILLCIWFSSIVVLWICELIVYFSYNLRNTYLKELFV